MTKLIFVGIIAVSASVANASPQGQKRKPQPKWSKETMKALAVQDQNRCAQDRKSIFNTAFNSGDAAVSDIREKLDNLLTAREKAALDAADKAIYDKEEALMGEGTEARELQVLIDKRDKLYYGIMQGRLKSQFNRIAREAARVGITMGFREYKMRFTYNIHRDTFNHRTQVREIVMSGVQNDGQVLVSMGPGKDNKFEIADQRFTVLGSRSCKAVERATKPSSPAKLAAERYVLDTTIARNASQAGYALAEDAIQERIQAKEQQDGEPYAVTPGNPVEGDPTEGPSQARH